MEAWGGATYDVALRFLAEDPWERLAALREAMPNIPLQMLLRGRNTVGYTPYPTAVTDAFVDEAAATGLDIFRIFDALNDVDQMRPAIEAVLATEHRGRRGRALLHRRPDRSRARSSTRSTTTCAWPSRSSTPARTCSRSRTWPGCCARPRPPAWSRALRERFDLPVHLHTHDTAGGQLATLLAAIDAGVDAVDAATRRDGRHDLASRRCRRSWPRPTTPSARPGSTCAAVCALEPYWEAVRQRLRARSSPASPAPTGRVYLHEIPGGQLSNLRQQAIALGLGERFEADRGHVRRGQPHPRQHRQGDPDLARSSATSRSPSSARAPTRRTSRTTPQQVRHPRLGHRLPQRRARRPARRLARAVPHQGPRRAARRSRA